MTILFSQSWPSVLQLACWSDICFTTWRFDKEKHYIPLLLNGLSTNNINLYHHKLCKKGQIKRFSSFPSLLETKYAEYTVSFAPLCPASFVNFHGVGQAFLLSETLEGQNPPPPPPETLQFESFNQITCSLVFSISTWNFCQIFRKMIS